jgi:hypothetical protein
MNGLGLGLRLLLGIAVMLVGQNAFAKNPLTDPLKIARECKSGWNCSARECVLAVSEW